MFKKKKVVNDFELSSQIYFKEIGKYKPLSFEEEQKLWKKYKTENDLSARDLIIKSNLKFVASVAKSYQGRGLSFSDLIAEGNCGLLRAMDKFDFSKGYKTISYSVWWIKQAILEALKERNGIEGDELPTDIDKQYDIEEDNHLSGKEKNIDFLTINELDYDELKNVSTLLVDSLDTREKKIINEYFGLNGMPLTLEEIGKDMNLTKERVRQIKERALKKLRSEVLMNSLTFDIYNNR